MDEQQKMALLESGLERQLHWISASDAKSAFVFTAATAMLTLLAAYTPSKVAELTNFTAGMGILAAVGQLASLLMVCLATFPRTDGPKYSLIYCGGISSLSIQDFQQQIAQLSSVSYLQDLATQVHRNAEIANTKFRIVKWSLISLFVSLIPWLLALWGMHVVNAQA